MDRALWASDWGRSQDWATPGSPYGTTSTSNTWATGFRAPYQLESPYVNNNTSYDTREISGVQYPGGPPPTMQLMKKFHDDWLQKEYGFLYDWDTGPLNPGGGAGDVSQNPSFGQFAKDPSVFGEIATAAQKYGIPANLLKVMIARESSGDWSGNNTRALYLDSRGERIVGYTGIMESTAKAWGYDFDQLIGNRALQIDAMANGLQRLYSQYGGQYGWDGVISVYYSGKPDQSYTPPDSYQYGTTPQYVAQVKEWWQAEDDWTRQNGGTVGGGTSAGMSSIDTPEWKPVNQYDAMVAEAARQYGVPANMLKAVMRFESGGNASAVSPAGATGLMQVMPNMHGLSAAQLRDPRTNIMKGAEILKNNYDRWGTWENAAKAYLAGDPNSSAFDAHGTGVGQYWSKVQGYWQELDAAASGMFGGEPGEMGPTTSTSAVWGGLDFNVTQEHGRTEWATANPWMYEYSYDVLGYLGHPGIDVGMPVGTQLFTPVGGTVIVAGGSGSYDNRIGSSPSQTGELRIRLDNGHEIILGHMAGIHVQAGQRVQPGQSVGLSGYPDAPHLHLEYRIPNSNFNGGWEAVDPRQALQGMFSGSLSGNTAGPGTRPMSYTDVLRAAARGEPVDWGMTMQQPGTWNSFLLGAIRGEIPHSNVIGGTGQVVTSTGNIFNPTQTADPYAGMRVVGNGGVTVVGGS